MDRQKLVETFNTTRMLYNYMHGKEEIPIVYDAVKRDEIVPVIYRNLVPIFENAIQRNGSFTDDDTLCVCAMKRSDAEYSFDMVQLTVSTAIYTNKKILVEKTKRTNPFVTWMEPGMYTLPQGHVKWPTMQECTLTIAEIDERLRAGAERELLEEVTVVRDLPQFIVKVHEAMISCSAKIFTAYINMPGSTSNHIDIIYAIEATEENGLLQFMDEDVLCSNEIDRHSVHLITFKDLCDSGGMERIDAYLATFLGQMPEEWTDDFTHCGQYLYELDRQLTSKE